MRGDKTGGVRVVRLPLILSCSVGNF